MLNISGRIDIASRGIKDMPSLSVVQTTTAAEEFAIGGQQSNSPDSYRDINAASNKKLPFVKKL